MRTHVGMFDVSHMGEVEVEGPGALAFLQLVLSNDVARIEVGGAQYSCLCNEDGGVIDDLFVYRLGGDRYLIVTNASNHETDLAWLGRWSRGFDVSVRDVADRYAMLAVQGPHARQVLGRALGIELPPRMRVAPVRVGRRPALACGTGYTGEDGVELLLDPEVAAPIWAELLDAGVVPCGLGARDTLRLEVCFPLHGNELSPERNPIEAGLGWCCAEATGFLGCQAVARRPGRGHGRAPGAVPDRGRRHPPRRQPGPASARTRSASSPAAPSRPRWSAAPAWPTSAADLAEPGTELEIDVRGKRRAARVASKPLYSSHPKAS